jgi:hypothetical protein
MLGMTVGPELDPFRPDEIGRRPGNEIVLYRWPDYEMVRILTTEQLHSITKQGFSEGAKNITLGKLDSLIFGLRERGRANTSAAVTALFYVQDFSVQLRDSQFHDAWIAAPHIPKTGLQRFSIWDITTRVRNRRSSMTALTDRERDLAASFFFGWLGLDPQWMREIPRLYFKVPFATAPQHPWTNFPMPGGDQNYELYRAPGFRAWMNHMVETWMAGPEGRLTTFSPNWPEDKTTKWANRFAEIVLRWRIGTGLDAEGVPEIVWASAEDYDPDRLRLFWEAEWGPRARDDVRPKGFDPPSGLFHRSFRSTWHTTPLDATRELEMLLSEDELDRWLEQHFVPGKPVIPDTSMEVYDLLDEASPPLWAEGPLLEWMRERELLPWT